MSGWVQATVLRYRMLVERYGDSDEGKKKLIAFLDGMMTDRVRSVGLDKALEEIKEVFASVTHKPCG